MREIRMEVVSVEEAIEYCMANEIEFIKCYNGRGENNYKIMMLAIDRRGMSVTNRSNISSNKNDIETEKQDTLIFADTPNGKLYLADTKLCNMGATFNINHAKLFKKTQAEEKVRHMLKRGTYTWKALKISR